MSLPRLVLVVLAVLVFSGTAQAQTSPGTLAPPGNSGVDQYVETVPTAKGPAQVGGGGSGGGDQAGSGDSGGTLPSNTRAALRESGSDGAAVEKLVESTRAADRPKTSSGSGSGSGTGSGKAESPGVERAVVDAASPRDGGVVGTAISRGVGGSGASGLGIALPLLLGAISLAGIVFVVARRRRLA